LLENPSNSNLPNFAKKKKKNQFRDVGVEDRQTNLISFLQFLREQVVFKGQWPVFWES
jgi:hypothetical protein